MNLEPDRLHSELAASLPVEPSATSYRGAGYFSLLATLGMDVCNQGIPVNLLHERGSPNPFGDFLKNMKTDLVSFSS